MKIHMTPEEVSGMRATAIAVAKENGYEKAVEAANDPVAEETRYSYLLIGNDLKAGIKEDAFCDFCDALFDILDGYQNTIQELVSSTVGIVRALDPVGFYKRFLAK